MTKRSVHLAAAALAAVSLLGTGLLSAGWVFGKYPNLAAAIQRGEATSAQVADASPAYLLLHLLAPPLVVRWLQAGAAALTVVLLFHLLHRLAGSRAAWLGAGALAIAQPWLLYSTVMEPDLLIGAAVACGIACLHETRTPRHLALAGLALGLAVSLRPTTLLFVAAVAAWLLLRRTPVRALAVFVLVTSLTGALPSVLLRAKAGQDLRGTMSAGQVFHQSHRPESLGFGATFPSLLKVVESQALASGPHAPDYAHELYRELARVSEPQRVDAAAAEAFWFERGLAYFRLEPRAAAGQLLDKLVSFLAPPSDEYDIPAVQLLLRRVVGVPLRWLCLLAAGCVGLLVARRNAAAMPWALHWGASLVVALLFYFHGRYAVGLVPTLAALIGLGFAQGPPSGAGADATQAHLGAWMRPRLVLVAPLLLLWLPSARWRDRMVERLNVVTLEVPNESMTRERYLDEQAAMPDLFWPTSPHGIGVGAEDPEIAQLAAARAVARYGTASPVDATLAAALWAAAGRCDTALELADKAATTAFVWAFGDRSVDPQLVASDCLLRLGRPHEALLRLEASNRAHPGRLDTLARLVAAGDVGQPTTVEAWERTLHTLHDPASVHFALARARRLWGDPQGALVDATWLRAHWPRATPFAEHERALALLDLHQPEQALEAWSRTLVVRAGQHEASRFDALVTAMVESAPGDARVMELAALHWRRRGHHAQAATLKP